MEGEGCGCESWAEVVSGACEARREPLAGPTDDLSLMSRFSLALIGSSDSTGSNRQTPRDT